MEKENAFLSSFFNPSWDSVDPTGGDFFESALSSMVSSPTTSNNVGSGEHIVLRELIGRLGGICNNCSGEISPHPYNFSNSVDNSCYSTPLHSPPRLNLSTMMEDYNHQITGNVNLNNQQYSSSAPFSTDPGFAEETARFSSFANKKLGGFSSQLGSCSRVLSSSHHRRHHRDNNKDGRVSASDKRLNSRIMDLSGDQRDMSTVSEQIPVRIEARNDSKKRKASARGKGKDNPSVSTQAKDVPCENSEPSTKRIKSEDGENEKDHKSDANEKKSKGNSKPTEPPKDYIHVRARRGQATDAHSLAERVRREKISERMKFLQDLVPGCNKVTGKAVMLDEIINYVQSLQLQVEFLSLKLANVNPETVFHMEDNSVASKEMFTSHGVSVQLHNPYASDSDYHHCLQAQADLYNALNNGTEPFSHDNTFIAALGRNQLPPHLDVPTLWGEDLHSVVPM